MVITDDTIYLLAIIFLMDFQPHVSKCRYIDVIRQSNCKIHISIVFQR